MLPGIISTLGEGCSPPPQIQPPASSCKFVLSPALVVSELRQFAALPGQTLCDYWLSFQELQETKVKLTTLLAPGLLAPGMDRPQDTWKWEAGKG